MAPSHRPSDYQDVECWSISFFFGLVVLSSYLIFPKSLQFDTRILDWTQEALRFLMAFAAEEGHLEDAEAHAMRLLDSSGPEKETGWVKIKTQKRRGWSTHSLKIMLLR